MEVVELIVEWALSNYGRKRTSCDLLSRYSGSPRSIGLLLSCDQVRDSWRFGTLMKRLGQRFHIPIGDGDAFVLAQMLRPTLDDECFQIPALLGRVFIEAPTNGSVAPANSADSLHGVDELFGAPRIDNIFDCHQHGAALVMDTCERRRLRPMVGGRGVNSGKTGELQTRSCGGPGQQGDRRDSQGGPQS